jgi:hypothetical protein
MGKIVPSCNHNIVDVCNQITLLTIYCINSRLLTIFKVIDAPIHVPNIFYPTLSFKFLKFNFLICFLFVPEKSTNFISYIV